MDERTALQQLEALGTAQNRKVYGRHGVTGPAFGVSYANLGKLRKAIGTDQRLALELWKSGNHDARVLATMIADPQQLDRKTVEAWSKDLADYVLTDAFSTAVAQSALAVDCARKWIEAKGEWLSTAGWNLIARGAGDPERYGEDELARCLETIERRIHASPNRTRYSMNGALIAIGLRSPALRKRAVAAARRIGTVAVDHGETGCKTPDAESYIEKAAAHRAGRPKPAAKKRPARKA